MVKQNIGTPTNISIRLYTYYSLRYLAKSNIPLERALLNLLF